MRPPKRRRCSSRSEVELFDEDQRPLGTVSVAGTYAIAGAGQRQEERFNDGNIHVVIDRTRTPVSASNVTVSLDLQAWQLDETEGSHTTEYLFVSNPATYVGSGERVFINGWSGDNVIDFHTDNEHSTLRETRLYLEYVDNPHNAAGVIDLSKRTWEGTFELFGENGGSLGPHAGDRGCGRRGSGAVRRPRARRLRTLDVHAVRPGADS
jgi:hypothetical protein